MNITQTEEVSGTYRQGTITTNFKRLVYKLGEPHMVGGDKTTAEWAFKTDDGTVFTIYDYYTISTPKETWDWHIGGFSPAAIEAVKALFPETKVTR